MLGWVNKVTKPMPPLVKGIIFYALFPLDFNSRYSSRIAKQVSKYNTLGKMETSFFLLKRILYYMIGLGLICAYVLCFAVDVLPSVRICSRHA